MSRVLSSTRAGGSYVLYSVVGCCLAALLIPQGLIKVFERTQGFIDGSFKNSTVATDIDNDVFFEAVSNIHVLDRQVGELTRICRKDHGAQDPDFQGSAAAAAAAASSCWLMPEKFWSPNTVYQAPMPMKTKPWMGFPQQESQPPVGFVLYYSTRDKRNGDNQRIHILGSSTLVGPWFPIYETDESSTPLQPDFGDHPCAALHSPSVMVAKKNLMYMYAQGRACEGLGEHEPTMLFESNNGIDWRIPTQNADHPFLLSNLTDLSPPTLEPAIGAYFYTIAKSQDESEEYSVLCRTKSWAGDLECGPRLGAGWRHCHLVAVQGRYLFIFYTLLSDVPERILLGTVDMATSTNWYDWRMLPGATVLEPKRYSARRNATVGDLGESGPISEEAAAPGFTDPAVAAFWEIRDPRFVKDAGQNEEILSGSLFYTIQGERVFAMSHLSINISSYLAAVSHRDQSNIPKNVLSATSLVRGKHPRRTVLITGVGRSGTTFMCKLFQQVGLNVSHDNHVDCGPYPGSDGASSWYDAFDDGRRYDTALHIVRDPVKVINSRISTMIHPHGNFKFVVHKASRWENVKGIRPTPESVFVFVLKHWVRRNSFIDEYAEWRERSEDLTRLPLAAWRMCMASYFGGRCPSLEVWREAQRAISSNTNSLEKRYPGENNTIRYQWSWERISNISNEAAMYVRIAKMMASKYGYIYDDEIPSSTRVAPDSYICGFDKDSKWDCKI